MQALFLECKALLTDLKLKSRSGDFKYSHHYGKVPRAVWFLSCAGPPGLLTILGTTSQQLTEQFITAKGKLVFPFHTSPVQVLVSELLKLLKWLIECGNLAKK